MYNRTFTTNIPRITLQARQRNAVKDAGSRFENKKSSVTVTLFDLEYCTVQPTKGDDLLVLDEGLRGKEIYTLRTNTPITTAVEGTDRLADQVEYDGVNGLSWFTIIKVREWSVGVIPHYEALIVKEPNQ